MELLCQLLYLIFSSLLITQLNYSGASVDMMMMCFTVLLCSAVTGKQQSQAEAAALGQEGVKSNRHCFHLLTVIKKKTVKKMVMAMELFVCSLFYITFLGETRWPDFYCSHPNIPLTLLWYWH